MVQRKPAEGGGMGLVGWGVGNVREGGGGGGGEGKAGGGGGGQLC